MNSKIESLHEKTYQIRSKIENEPPRDVKTADEVAALLRAGGGEGDPPRRTSITRCGVKEVEQSIEDPENDTEHFSVRVIHHYHGPIVNQAGSGNTANVGSVTAAISNATIGSVAIGPSAATRGSLQPAFISKVDLEEARKALTDDQDHPDEIVWGRSEGLREIGRRLRKLEFDVASVAEVQARIKSGVDDAAVAALSIQAKAKGSPASLEFIKVLLGSAVMAELAKWLLGP